MDVLTLVNLVLCIIIAALGYWAFKKSSDSVPLYIGIAFGLFGISHLSFLLGLRDTLETPLIVVRLLAYLVVIFALYKVVKK
ncbi:MAG: hypothetical protein HXS41_13025 [Theionarchaea archaeon]|nr:hypothetical protein [Theionarchaea archaeon]MBU7000642.1 hypothetical protein [Theionarchaea archaeon]MBU7021975.1 hypothetical protein [Theionarchaea archaeon]MBU7035785.1 hypothetical protein [Theionarchaea archaeon]MBU7041373.1 hypothetical protein [Theionarchaea archaeon]